MATNTNTPERGEGLFVAEVFLLVLIGALLLLVGVLVGALVVTRLGGTTPQACTCKCDCGGIAPQPALKGAGLGTVTGIGPGMSATLTLWRDRDGDCALSPVDRKAQPSAQATPQNDGSYDFLASTVLAGECYCTELLVRPQKDVSPGTVQCWEAVDPPQNGPPVNFSVSP